MSEVHVSRTSGLQPERSIDVIDSVIYCSQSPIFRKIGENEHYRRRSWPSLAFNKLLKWLGAVWEPQACPLGPTKTNYKMASSDDVLSRDLNDPTEQ